MKWPDAKVCMWVGGIVLHHVRSINKQYHTDQKSHTEVLQTKKAVVQSPNKLAICPCKAKG